MAKRLFLTSEYMLSPFYMVFHLGLVKSMKGKAERNLFTRLKKWKLCERHETNYKFDKLTLMTYKNFTLMAELENHI